MFRRQCLSNLRVAFRRYVGRPETSTVSNKGTMASAPNKGTMASAPDYRYDTASSSSSAAADQCNSSMDAHAPNKNSTASAHTMIMSEGRLLPPPPKGFNKSCRDWAKLLLALTCVSLLAGGDNKFATCCSAAAILLLKQGTIFSTKNWKWGILSVTSFGVSLTAACLYQGTTYVDEDKAYTLKILLWLAMKFLQTAWAVVLALFLYSAFTNETATAARRFVRTSIKNS